MDIVAIHLLVAIAFLGGVAFGLVLDTWLLPALVDTRIAMLRNRGR